MSERRYDPKQLGAYGERLVAEWYLARGYQILAQNWRCGSGELDLIVTKGGEVVICEVKTRTSARFGSPFEAVGPTKQIRLRKLAAIWLRDDAPFRPHSVRFDVAGVIGRNVEVRESVI